MSDDRMDVEGREATEAEDLEPRAKESEDVKGGVLPLLKPSAVLKPPLAP